MPTNLDFPSVRPWSRTSHCQSARKQRASSCSPPTRCPARPFPGRWRHVAAIIGFLVLARCGALRLVSQWEVEHSINFFYSFVGLQIMKRHTYMCSATRQQYTRSEKQKHVFLFSRKMWQRIDIKSLLTVRSWTHHHFPPPLLAAWQNHPLTWSAYCGSSGSR